jgi:short-subunit dehydrogenase
MNKVIVITGGTKGLGRAIAEKFAENKFDVIVCSRSRADLNLMVSEWEATFPDSDLQVYCADVRVKEEVIGFAEFILGRVGSVDVLVNNAGVFLPGSVLSGSEGTLERLVETNLYSAYYLSGALVPAMRENRQGHIFNMCSIASIVAYPAGGLYSISKFALLGFSKCLREELKMDGVRVTSVLPGATWSDSWKGANYPVDRLMQASDIAQVIWGAHALSENAVVEELIIRPQLGDL